MMCHLPFAFVHNYYVREFLKAIRPNFEKQLGGEGIRKKMAGSLLDEIHEEAIQVASEALAEKPGLITIGMDGHKDGRNRTLETVTRAKLGVSVFAGCEYMKTTRATGANLATVLKRYIMHSGVQQFAAVVADNTSSNLAMFDELKKVLCFSMLACSCL